MKKNDLTLDMITKPLGAFLNRFHLVTFVIIVVGSLAAATYLYYNQIIAAEDTTNATSVEPMPNFDTATIDQLNQLKDTNEATDLVLPDNQRINPFME